VLDIAKRWLRFLLRSSRLRVALNTWSGHSAVLVDRQRVAVEGARRREGLE
jgi:hypothetical protein